jgi:hypothetical protein
MRRKNQGLEDSANENDMWVWMRPHISFCTIEKCDLYFHFLLRSLPLVLNFSSSSFHGAFHALVLADEVLPLLLLIIAPFFFYLFSFFRIFLEFFFCWGETLLVGVLFLENHLMGRIKVETRNKNGCKYVWSLWNAW